MRVLVTGGAGYIGSVVGDLLIEEGHRVVAYDDLSTGFRDAVAPGAELVCADIRDVDELRATLADHRIDAVIHLAGRSLVAESILEPGDYYAVNLVGGLALLEAMREAGVRLLVLASSASVYGEPERQPIDETEAVSPTSPFAETKAALERAMAWYGAAYGLRSCRLRFVTAAGATDQSGEWHEPETHLIPLVLQVAAGLRPYVTVYGDDHPTPDGTPIRDYVHVGDVARAHVHALRALAEGRAGPVYNVGSGSGGASVLDVIDVARQVTGADIDVRFGARRAGDPSVLVVDADRIRDELGFCPEASFLHLIVASAWRRLQRMLETAMEPE